MPVTIKASTDISGSFQMNLLCNGNEINFYRNGVSLSYGEELKLSPAPSLVLTKDVIENLKGNCKIKAVLLDESILTNEFKISDLIIIEIAEKEIVFKPGESVLIEGEARKENGNAVNGFIELMILIDYEKNITESIEQLGTINNGFFSINISLSEDTKAGNHWLKLTAYEKNFAGEISNNGFMDYNIYVIQVPTSVEIFFENKELEPGTNLRVKAILHDQTGEKIESTAMVTIKNAKDKIMEEREVATDEFLEYEIKYNEPPAEWKVIAFSNELTGEAGFNIATKQDVKIELINKTIILTNIGNVMYCDKTVLVKIGNESGNINPCLDVDGVQKYVLTAPDGEYYVEVIKDGESVLSENVMLTGKAVDVKEAKGVLSFVRHPIVWIFLILILGLIAFMVFKKGYKRSFIGGFKKKRAKPPKPPSKKRKISFGKKPLISPTNKAELSLSIKGNKQDASVVCLKIKNFKEVESGKGGVSETLKKILELTDKAKAVVYENQNNIFFILAPARTKTFKNERSVLMLAQKIKEILEDHNKLFKQKINYGIGLNHGEIIAKDEAHVLKFMAMKNLITAARKVAELADKEVLLSQEIEERFGSDVKTKKYTREKTRVYKVKNIVDREEHREFISAFLKRIEEGKKKEE